MALRISASEPSPLSPFRIRMIWDAYVVFWLALIIWLRNFVMYFLHHVACFYGFIF